MPSRDTNANKAKVEEDRRYSIEAAIVRIIKVRKTLPHLHLISEATSQSFLFRPDVRDLEKSIEILEDREYLAGSSEDASVFNYSA
jgi:Cullin protein neddylation domain